MAHSAIYFSRTLSIWSSWYHLFLLLPRPDTCVLGEVQQHQGQNAKWPGGTHTAYCPESRGLGKLECFMKRRGGTVTSRVVITPERARNKGHGWNWDKSIDGTERYQQLAVVLNRCTVVWWVLDGSVVFFLFELAFSLHVWWWFFPFVRVC